MSYSPTNWQTGDVVTAEKLNKIEGGIEGSADGSVYQEDKIEMPGNEGTAGELTIILPGTTSGHGTDANCKTSIHLGPGYSANRSSNIHLGQVVTPSSNNKGLFPWLLDYLEQDGKLVSYTDGQGCINVGANHIRVAGNSPALAVGSSNIVKKAFGFVLGSCNVVDAYYSVVLGYGLKGSSEAGQCMVGKYADAESGDLFVVGNGTASGATRIPSTAFKVTSSGDAIAQNALGIKKSDGTVVSITADQLEALLALLN